MGRIKMKSIGLKLWTGMMALVIIVLILLWLFQIVFLESFYVAMRTERVKSTAYELAKQMEYKEKEEMQHLFDAVAYRDNVIIDALDIQGNILFAAGNIDKPMIRTHIRKQAFLEVIAGKEVIVSMEHARFGNRFMFMGLPVYHAETLAGVLFINMPIAPVEATALILKQQLLYITIILLVAALILSFFVARTLTRPIRDITKVAQGLAQGDFDVRIKPKGKDEIRKLSDAFNHMAQEISKVDQLRKDLIANVSHELRTPLSLIRGYAEIIKDVSGNDVQKREKQLDIIIEESIRLSKIVDDILNLSQMQSGYFHIDMERFYINQKLVDVIKRYEIRSEQLGIKISLENTEDMLVSADEKRIEQVLYNLINNAFHHTHKEGVISINVIEKEKVVRIEIADTGDGIEQEELKYIWERYYKSDKKKNQIVMGTGLGLAIVKNILQAHKVDFGVESEKGVGTTFWFELDKV